MKVLNMDIAGVVRRLRRFRYEANKSVSAGLANTTAADMLRSKSYLIAVETYLNWVVAQPQLDLPEWSPKEIDLGDPEKIDMAENEAILDLVTMYDAFEVELTNSQSARMSTGVISHDEKRVRNLLLKMNQFLDNYVAVIQPLDLPEASPLRAMTGPGRVGV